MKYLWEIIWEGPDKKGVSSRWDNDFIIAENSNEANRLAGKIWKDLTEKFKGITFDLIKIERQNRITVVDENISKEKK
jgi:hypothetical protein